MRTLRRPAASVFVSALLGALCWMVIAPSALLAQGSIGFSQKQGDNERKFMEGLEREDLLPRGLLVLRIEGDSIEVADHRFDGLQQLALATIDFDGTEFGATSLRPSEERDPYSGRLFVGELPALERVKKLRLRFEVLDRDERVERKEKLLCKLDHPMPPSDGAIEVYVVAGSTRDFWCRDVAVDSSESSFAAPSRSAEPS